MGALGHPGTGGRWGGGFGHFRNWARSLPDSEQGADPGPDSEAHEGGHRPAIWPPLGPEVVLWEVIDRGGDQTNNNCL
jgi:hypothetical protein